MSDKRLSEQDFTDWPRYDGRLLCSPEHPMPKGANGTWAHTRVETISSDSDFQYGTEWDQEVPQ